MTDLFLAGFMLAFLALGVRRPFVWVLAYLYVDILAPQKISYFLLAALPISMIAFFAAFGGWLFADGKTGSRFTARQGLMLVLLLWCGMTTLMADYPEQALGKWEWVWKALFFAMFLPLTLRTRLRIEAATLVMVLSAGAIIISGGIKTLGGGGGYGSLHLFVNDNTGLYEGSILSCVAISIIPIALWLAKFGTIYPPSKYVTLFTAGLVFACLLMPIGTQARTGLLCIALLGVLMLRTVKRRGLYIGGAALALMIAVPFLPQSYLDRMSTIQNHQADESASTRVAVWKWTWEYVKEHPTGGGFLAYLGNTIKYDRKETKQSGSGTQIEEQEVNDKSRAYHSSYFEMLGEQGFPGFFLWIALQLGGLIQMERLRARWRRQTAPHLAWISPYANALQQAQLVYLLGSLFVGIAFQPFILMLIGLQCALWNYARRIDAQARNEDEALPLADGAPQRMPSVRTMKPLNPAA